MTMSELIEVKVMKPKFKGYRYTGEHRVPEDSEYYLRNGAVFRKKDNQNLCLEYLILEKVRWRAEKGEMYCFVNSLGEIDFKEDWGNIVDDNFYKLGNYFQTIEEAKESKFFKVFNGENNNES